jgi:glutathione S-transferase
MIQLHHNSLSTCSQKVRLVLAKKDLAWQSQHLDLWQGDQPRPEYLALNPNGVVPTLVDDALVIIESSVIIEYLDEAYPDPLLKSATAADRATMRLWTKQLDEGVHSATSTLSSAVAFRFLVSETQLDNISNPERRQRKREQIQQGMESPLFAAALQRFARLFSDMEVALARQPWLAGEHCSLADLALAPTLGRVEQLKFQGLLANRPRLEDWYARIKARPTYAKAITAWLDQSDLDLMAEKAKPPGPRRQQFWPRNRRPRQKQALS